MTAATGKIVVSVGNSRCPSWASPLYDAVNCPPKEAKPMFFTKKSAVQSIIIENPCSVRWEEMRGDETVRFCDQCKLNVHNLTGMSQKEAEQLITSQPKRPCVYFYRRDDGIIVTDNCPKMLRPVRNRISAYAAGALLAFSWCLASSVSAQGLVGAPVDPRYGSVYSMRTNC